MRSVLLLLIFCVQAAAQDAQVTALQERLKKDRTDDEANFLLGKLLCFERGAWRPGLFHLAQGTDKSLRILAQRDLAQPMTADEQIDVGDGWWNLGETEKGNVQRHLRLRAVHWYRQAAPKATGLRRGRIESRIRLLELEK